MHDSSRFFSYAHLQWWFLKYFWISKIFLVESNVFYFEILHHEIVWEYECAYNMSACTIVHTYEQLLICVHIYGIPIQFRGEEFIKWKCSVCFKTFHLLLNCLNTAILTDVSKTFASKIFSAVSWLKKHCFLFLSTSNKVTKHVYRFSF